MDVLKLGMGVLVGFLLLGGFAVVQAAKVQAKGHGDRPPKVSEVRKKLKNSEVGTLHVVGTVTIDGITEEELYSFLVNFENDVLWYPGTLSSERVKGDGGVGSVYQEVVYFFEQQIPVKATVLELKPKKSIWFTSDGVFTNLTNYRIKKVGGKKSGKVQMTLDSTVEATNGVTQEFFAQYLGQTLQNLLTALGKTGSIEIH